MATSPKHPSSKRTMSQHRHRHHKLLPLRHTSFKWPERFKPGPDAQDDVAPPDSRLHQSVFSLITTAGTNTGGSKPTVASQTLSSVSENEQDSGSDTEEESKIPEIPQQADVTIPSSNSLLSAKPQFSQETELPKSSHARLLRPGRIPHDEEDTMTQSMILDPKYKAKAEKVSLDMSVPNLPSSRATPILDEMVRARALSVHQNKTIAEPPTISIEEEVRGSDLRDRLNEIFDFGHSEDVVAEYPCWLLQSVLLQGYLWVTSGHVCFYAYLPRRDDTLVKSGYLTKRGKTSAKWNRRWMILNGDRLAYYHSPSDLYFPAGAISLRMGISANMLESKDKSRESKEFNLVTRTRTHYFRADSHASAKEWVKILQKVIFRSLNDGDSVKISLPIANVMEIEESPVVNLMETFRLRVVDNEDTFAIDDYFFSFVRRGQECYKLLRDLIDSSPTKRQSMDLLSPASALSGPPNLEDLHLKEGVRATLDVQATSPSPRENRRSGDWSKDLRASVRRSIDFSRSARTPSTERPDMDYRRSFNDRGRRSPSMTRSELFAEDRSPSTGAPVRADLSEHFSQASPTAPTASQILQSDAIFHGSGVNDLGLRAAPPRPEAQVDKPQTHQRVKSLPDHPDAIRKYTASPAMRTLVQAGQYPIKAASGIAGYIRRGSQRVSSSLATESRGYVEKVHGYWAGSGKHYTENPATAGLEQEEEPLSADEIERHTARFRAHFALSEDERLLATYFGYIHKVLPLYGKIYISNRNFCFRSLLPGTKTLLILPLHDIENVVKEKAFQFGYHGLVLTIQGYEEIFFEFTKVDVRDDCCVTLLTSIQEFHKTSQEPVEHDDQDAAESEAARAEHRALMSARLMKSTSDASNLSQTSPLGSSLAFDDPLASIVNFKPAQPLRITCLTIGSRGDVQPYIALCKGLLAEGHQPRIATHREFESWVRSHGIDFAPVEGDPAELMRICIENGMFTYNFLKEASSTFRGWIDELLKSAWTACQDTDILIESPSAMAGIHIAEALRIPYFRAFTMPWTRTRAYPHAFAVPDKKIGGAYNYLSYVLFDTLFWTAIAGQVNRWRKTCLGIDSTNLDKLHPNKVPFLYNFSPSVVAPPLDYSDWIRVTGYWFLDEGSEYEPPRELLDFIAKAREDKKKLVYIGFGSIVVSDPAALTKTVVDSVLKADVRCILSKGWSDRLSKKDAGEVEVPLPSDIFQIKSAPHDWLFKQIDAAAHHGGAGTTGASLRMGLPTIIKPFFGDQFFFGSRVEDLGVGICMKKLNVSLFSRALWEATHSERMIVKARLLGEQIRKENGVAVAIKTIYRDLEYAKSLIKQPKTAGEVEIPDEESWTFIGDESDMEMLRRSANLEQISPRLL